METKVCNKCGRELPLEAFGKCVRNADGLLSSCKECINAYNRTARSRRLLGGGVTESKENPDLAMFTTKVLLDEIKARGYSGTLEYKKTIRI